MGLRSLNKMAQPELPESLDSLCIIWFKDVEFDSR